MQFRIYILYNRSKRVRPWYWTNPLKSPDRFVNEGGSCEWRSLCHFDRSIPLDPDWKFHPGEWDTCSFRSKWNPRSSLGAATWTTATTRAWATTTARAGATFTTQAWAWTTIATTRGDVPILNSRQSMGSMGSWCVSTTLLFSILINT